MFRILLVQNKLINLTRVRTKSGTGTNKYLNMELITGLDEDLDNVVVVTITDPTGKVTKDLTQTELDGLDSIPFFFFALSRISKRKI
uniref:Uncharacterized protein n=1 Tax=Pithovirus LCDPAC01 TaxID=2506600 RepID=A0A481YMG5_9VIRU|nr:MAG: hypothetical protein LCDPAC01_00200 [Pithovirus LCDPAC01]